VPPNSVFGSAAFVTVKAYFSSFSTRRMIGYSFRGSPVNRGRSPDVTKIDHAPITAEATSRSKDVQTGLVCAKGA
jgi:hypothetical protein